MSWWFVGEKARGLFDFDPDYTTSYAIPNALFLAEMSFVKFDFFGP